MVVYNAASKELTAKIVYYGPGLSGKTTNIQFLHGRLEPSSVGNLMTLAATQDRTIYFDLLPVELGDIKGYRIRFQVATVPGQAPYNETRRLVLRGVDGVVFVVDSRWSMLPKNVESFQNLRENLKEEGISFQGLPLVIQFNKRDLPDVLAVDALQEALGIGAFPFIEAVASDGRGVIETFKLISKLTFVDILRRLQKKDVSKSVKPGMPTLTSWKNSIVEDDARPSGPAATPAAPSRTISPAPAPGPTSTTEPFPVVRPAPLESPFAPASLGVASAVAGETRESEVVFEEPPELPTLPPSREETNPAYFPPPEGPAPRAPRSSAGSTGALDLSQLLPDRPAARAPRVSRESLRPDTAPPRGAPAAAPDSAIKEKLEEVARRLAEAEDQIRRLDEQLAQSSGEQEKSEQRLQAALAREAERLQDEWEAARTDEGANRKALEDSIVGLTNSVQRIEKEMAEASAREMEMVARGNKDSTTFQSMVEKLNFGIIENESRLNEVSAAHEARIARIEGLAEDLQTRLSLDRDNLRRMLSEIEDRIQQHREESDRRLSGLDTIRESLASALSDLAERLRRAVESAAKS